MKDSILVFGVGDLQKSIIERCKAKNLFVVGVDPQPDATCKELVDAFEIVGGQDYEKTFEVAERYHVKGIITAATDKPLIMMTRMAERLDLPFFSMETAECSTDKFLMKQKLMEAGVPCAKGFLLNNMSELKDIKADYPVIVKPRDNSGSRGVIYCKSLNEVEIALSEALQYTRKENVLVEKFIDGKEYSVEGIHYDGESQIIQITEKITTAFPYNVELAHIQPADISTDQQNEIHSLISKTAKALGFENCASHTEIRINSKGIYVIETSPRLGGDYISSTLVPLSTEINMEDILIEIATNKHLTQDCFKTAINKFSAIKYFELSSGIIISLNGLDRLNTIQGIRQWNFRLKPGEEVNRITSSLNRYGYAIFQTDTAAELEKCMSKCKVITDALVMK